MNSPNQLLHRIADPMLTHDERARLRCQLAKELEETGNYEGARKAMGELWSRVGERPIVDDLDQETAAEVLLRTGVLTGWIGSANQLENSQELAKNLISESITRFEVLQNTEKVAEAQADLAYCYWRQGEFDEARVMLREALSRLTDINSETKAVALLRSAIVERAAKRFNDAFRVLTMAAPIIEVSVNNTLKGKFHNQFATVLENLGRAENRKDYVDQALIEYAAASYYFEQAGHTRYQACVENNLGFLFSTIGKHHEAHEHLDHAQILFTSLKDHAHLAGVDETRAKVFLTEGRVSDAEKLARSVVQTLERGGEQSLLAEALTTHGIAIARSGRYQHARRTLQRAIEAAQQAGDSESAGQAALTLIEELGEQLAPDDLSTTYDHAAELLSTSQHPVSKDRLILCARRVLFLVGALPMPPTWMGFSFKAAMRRYQARLIERALRDAGGAVVRAAQLLGVKRQSLNSMLRKYHQNLLHLRPPIEPRKSSLMFRDGCCTETQTVTILHVEDSVVIANTVKETLEAEGWTVETCADGIAALKRIASNARYDLLIFDNQLPGLGGVELIRQTRALAHRQQTPIIMFSGDDVEMSARRAGANAFLRKPGDMPVIAETIARLLTRRKGREA
jgi:two-component system chemotaxis response regulator CheY